MALGFEISPEARAKPVFVLLAGREQVESLSLQSLLHPLCLITLALDWLILRTMLALGLFHRLPFTEIREGKRGSSRITPPGGRMWDGDGM
jgi:hypothetical protein